MALFTVKKYITIGVLQGLTKIEWEIYDNPSMDKLLARSYKYRGDDDFLSLRIALKKNDNEWYEETDNVFARVRLYSKNATSRWVEVKPNKEHLNFVWVNNDTDDDDNTVQEIPKLRVGVIETSKDGQLISDFLDIGYEHKKQKEFRHEIRRDDY